MDNPSLASYVTVCIVANGAPIPHIHNQDPEAPPGTVYIQASTGDAFSVWVEFCEPFPTDKPVSVKVALDGSSVSWERIIFPDWLLGKGPTIISGTWFEKNGKWYTRNFCFSELETTDDLHTMTTEEQKRSLVSLGKITVECFFLKDPIQVIDPNAEEECTVELGAVPEKALKGRNLSHHATLEAPMEKKAPTYWSCDHADDAPFVTYVFKYRSLAALEASGLVPPTESHISPLASQTMREPSETTKNAWSEIIDVSDETLKDTSPSTINKKRPRKLEDNGDKERYYNDEVTFVREQLPKHRPRLPRPDEEVVILDD